MMNEFLIASICAGMSANATMCSKTLEAASKQAGAHQVIKTAEQKVKSVAENEAEDVLGNKIYSALTYGVVATKISSGGTGSVKMEGGPLCDKITLTGSKKQGSVEFGWNF